ncbi:MAG: DUF3267 domain-containing protein [Clostridia bacterium]|nr:DUF3267 domain-containing protein [Clostridia bacterium]
MRAFSQLPDDYREIYAVDLQKDKKLSLLVNGLALLIGVLLAVPMHFVVPLSALFDMSEGLGAYFVRFGVLFVSLVVYMVLHELVHGIAMKLCGTKRVKYGYTGLYAFAGSEDYYDKTAYIFIALAPVVLWGVVLLVLQFFVPTSWFWVVYCVQLTNLSGAAGDYYVTVRFSRLPKNILVRDSGVSMCVYSNAEEE